MLKMFRKKCTTKESHDMHNLSVQGDKKLCIFIVAFFLTSAINTSIKTICPIPKNLWGITSSVFMLILGGTLLLALPVILNRGWKKLLISEGIFACVFVCSFLAGNAPNSLLLRSGFWSMGVCIPLAFAAYVLLDKEMLLKMLYMSSRIQCIPLWMTLYFMKQTGEYDMSAAYSLVLPTLVFLFYYFEKGRVRDLVVSFISIILILIWGARGPLFCIVFYVFLQMIFTKRGNMKKVVWGVFISAGFSFFLFYSWILEGIEIILVRFGISSYILRRLIEGSFFSSGGRDMLRSYYIERILEKPFSGWGVVGGWLGFGQGPHNMLLEFVLAFGIIVGVAVCLVAFLFLVKMFLLKKNEHRELTFMFASYSIVVFLVAGNWLERPEWFIFVALCVSAKTKKRVKWL